MIFHIKSSLLLKIRYHRRNTGLCINYLGLMCSNNPRMQCCNRSKCRSCSEYTHMGWILYLRQLSSKKGLGNLGSFHRVAQPWHGWQGGVTDLGDHILNFATEWLRIAEMKHLKVCDRLPRKHGVILTCCTVTYL